jgi:hypothetical protein
MERFFISSNSHSRLTICIHQQFCLSSLHSYLHLFTITTLIGVWVIITLLRIRVILVLGLFDFDQIIPFSPHFSRTRQKNTDDIPLPLVPTYTHSRIYSSFLLDYGRFAGVRYHFVLEPACFHVFVHVHCLSNSKKYAVLLIARRPSLKTHSCIV